jgi:hypothetical protein
VAAHALKMGPLMGLGGTALGKDGRDKAPKTPNTPAEKKKQLAEEQRLEAAKAKSLDSSTVVGMTMKAVHRSKKGKARGPTTADVTLASETNPEPLLARGALVRRNKHASGGAVELMECRPLFEPQRTNARGGYPGRQMDPTVLIKTSFLGSSGGAAHGGAAPVSRFVQDHRTVRAHPGRSRSIFHSESVMYGGFLWARRAHPKTLISGPGS